MTESQRIRVFFAAIGVFIVGAVIVAATLPNAELPISLLSLTGLGAILCGGGFLVAIGVWLIPARSQREADDRHRDESGKV